MNLETLKHWRFLCEQARRDKVDIKTLPWYPEFAKWACSEEGREVIRRTDQFCEERVIPWQQIEGGAK